LDIDLRYDDPQERTDEDTKNKNYRSVIEGTRYYERIQEAWYEVQE
jgi:hypothetical protein